VVEAQVRGAPNAQHTTCGIGQNNSLEGGVRYRALQPHLQAVHPVSTNEVVATSEGGV